MNISSQGVIFEGNEHMNQIQGVMHCLSKVDLCINSRQVSCDVVQQ